MTQERTLQLDPVADLNPFLGTGTLVALSVGPDLGIYAAIALEELDYRRTLPNGVSFARIRPEKPQTYRVVAFHDGSVTLDVRISNERINIHDIQPLPNGELLLISCRSRYRGPNDFDKNGRVYSSDGRRVREILLGDGIQQIQATTGGTIWTSFSDEGIFGNFGWDDPIGASGLVASDAEGHRLYEFYPSEGLDSICDCYALNVASDSDTWLCYYTQFPLVLVRNREIESYWDIPIEGSSAFAVSGRRALFRGGYDEANDYYLFELLPDGRTQTLAKLQLTDEAGHPLVAEKVLGRSDRLFLSRDHKIYSCDVASAAS